MKILMEFYDFSNSDIFPTLKNISNILYYSGITHKNLILTKLSINFILFRTCFINYKKNQDYIMNKLDFICKNCNDVSAIDEDVFCSCGAKCKCKVKMTTGYRA